MKSRYDHLYVRIERKKETKFKTYYFYLASILINSFFEQKKQHGMKKDSRKIISSAV